MPVCVSACVCVCVCVESDRSVDRMINPASRRSSLFSLGLLVHVNLSLACFYCGSTAAGQYPHKSRLFLLRYLSGSNVWGWLI